VSAQQRVLFIYLLLLSSEETAEGAKSGLRCPLLQAARLLADPSPGEAAASGSTRRAWRGFARAPASLLTAVASCRRPSMSGLHLVRRGREHRKMDLQRDFTVASPAEFVTRFGGNRVIEKVFPRMALPWHGWWVVAFHGSVLECCWSLPCPPGSDRWQPRAVFCPSSPVLMGWEREALPALPLHSRVSTAALPCSPPAPCPSSEERFQPDVPCPRPPRSSSPTTASPL